MSVRQLGLSSVGIGTKILSGTTGSVLFVDASGNLGQDNSNFFWDDSNNRLGLGTTTPGSRLHVVGTVQIDPSVSLSIGSAAAIDFKRTSDNWNPARIEQVYEGGTFVGALSFQTNGSTLGSLTEKMRITSAGNVGIGTSGPNYKLETVGTIASTGSASQFLVTKRSDDAGAWSIYSQSGSLQFYDQAAGGDKITILTGGNVGIGTAGPQALLHVNGGSILTTAGSGASSFRDILIGNGSGGLSTNEAHGLEWAVGASSATTLARIESVFDGTSVNMNFRNFYSSGARTAILMTLLATGDLGIGTATPAVTLDVAGSSLRPARILGSDGTGFYLGSYGSSWGGMWSAGVTPSTANYALIAHPTSGTALNALSGGAIQFNINDVTKMYLNSSGNVGIGTTSPSNGRLEISDGTSSKIALTKTGAGAGTAYITNDGGLNIVSNSGADVIYYRTGTHVFANQAGSLEYMRLDAGNLGIGTTAPNVPLDVVINSTTQIRFGSSSTNNGGYFTSTNANQAIMSGGVNFTGSGWVARDTVASLMALDAGTVKFYTNTGLTSGNAYTISERMRIETDGKVGIGTVPNYQLHAYKDQNANTQVGVENPNGGTGGYANFIAKSDSAIGYFGVGPSTATISALSDAAFVLADTTASGGLVLSSRAAAPITFFTNGSETNERMRISSAGLVGIGTASPAAELDVINYARVLGSAGASAGAPASGEGIELTYDTTTHLGYLISYDRTNSLVKALQIAATTTTVAGGAAASKVLIVKGATSQSANLQEWQDNGASILASVSSAGTFNLSTLTASKTVGTDSSKNLISINTTVVTDSDTATAQTADIGSTTLTTTGAGIYQVSYYLVDSTADLTAGAVRVNVSYADAATSQTVQSSPVVLTTLGSFTQGTFIVQLASGALTYTTSHTGIFGTAAYNLYITAERIS